MNKKYEDARVLVVDDNNINLYTINQMLITYGINADCVPNGKACIKKVSKKQYDLIFMDHMMPEMDGIETFAELKKDEAFKTPVVVLTANSGEEFEKLYKDEGFSAYIVKPVNAELLGEVLEKHLGECKEASDANEPVNIKPVSKRDELIAAGFTDIDALIESGIPLEEFDMILSIFAEESLEKMADADRHYEDKNMREYAVIVHGLKNDAGMVSDMSLRENALKHEMESKAGNIQFVTENWPVLKKQWQETVDRINSYLNK